MSFLPPFRPGALNMPAYAPGYIAKLERQREAIGRLCSAARDLLCADIDETLEAVKNPPPAPVIRPSLETLVNAQKERDQIQTQMDALLKLCDEIPDTQAEFLRSMQKPALEEALKRADEWISQIQAGLELDPAKAEKWTVQRPGTDYFKVLEVPPTFLYAITRPAPDRPGETEIAENADHSLRAFATESAALEACSQMDGWTVGTLLLQPVASMEPPQ